MAGDAAGFHRQANGFGDIHGRRIGRCEVAGYYDAGTVQVSQIGPFGIEQMTHETIHDIQ